MLSCCKQAYAGQMSGKCISMLPIDIRPTTSPTNADRTANFWYPMYEKSWSTSGCSNKLPLPYNNINDRPNYSTGEECCAKAYAGQSSKACVCEHLDPPQSGCPNVIDYEVTTIVSTVTGTISLGDITIPTDTVQRDALISSLESVILTRLSATMGNDIEVNILSIGGTSVRRYRTLLRNRILSTTNVEYEVIVTSTCTEDCQSTTDTAGNEVLNDVTEAMSDNSAMESAFQSSGNSVLAGSTVEGNTVDPDVVTTSSTSTETGVSIFVVLFMIETEPVSHFVTLSSIIYFSLLQRQHHRPHSHQHQVQVHLLQRLVQAHLRQNLQHHLHLHTDQGHLLHLKLRPN